MATRGSCNSCGQNSVVVKRTVWNSRWWFTLIADEAILSTIESKWINIHPDHKWSLLRSFGSRPHIRSIFTVAQPAASEVNVSQVVSHSLTACPSPSYSSEVRQGLCPQTLSLGCLSYHLGHCSNLFWCYSSASSVLCI